MISLFGAYAVFNFCFTIFYLNEGGGPDRIKGDLVLHSHGRVIRKLTPEEFQIHQAYVVRTFSGHWMAFYSMSMTILYARLAEQRLAMSSKDQSRHTVES